MSDLSKDMKNIKELLNKVADAGVLMPDIKVSLELQYPGIGAADTVKLDELVNLGLLRKKVFDRTISCPKCGSVSIFTRYACPSCSSINIEKSRLIQHVDCGYTDSEVKFSKRESSVLICPKCGKEIDERRLRIYASFFECGVCHSRTSTPSIVHKCHKCDNIFKPDEAVLKPLYSYELTGKGLSIIKRE